MINEKYPPPIRSTVGISSDGTIRILTIISDRSCSRGVGESKAGDSSSSASVVLQASAWASQRLAPLIAQIL